MMLLLALAACTGAKDGATDPYWGTIVADRAGETGEVQVYSGFGFNSASNGKGLVYLTANPDATCDTALNGLTGGDPDFDPTVVMPASQCTVFAYFDYDAGTLTDSAAPGSPSIVSIVAVGCAMDDGAWDYQDDGGDNVGYYYSGHLWQGSPQTYQLTVSGGDEAAFDVSLSMSTWDGNFIYEEMTAAPAEGLVVGSATAEWCPELGQTVYF